MRVKEILKRLLNSRKKRIAAAAALVSALIAVTVLLYLILKTIQKFTEGQNPEGMFTFNNYLNTQEGVRATLNDALEKPTLNIAELDSHFLKLKKLIPTEPSPSLSDYAASLYEDFKSKEAKGNIKQGAKRLKRLLRTVKILNPDYVDDPSLKGILDSSEDSDVEPTADIVADAEAQDIIRSDTPSLVSPQQARRSKLTSKMQKALDKRNICLKELCELGKSLPGELRAEFNKWKFTGFKTTHSPTFVAFIEKARNSGEKVLLDTLWAYCGYQLRQARFISKSHKHSTDRDDALYDHRNHSELARFVYDLKDVRIPISNAMLEWLKGEDWEQMKHFVEHELSSHLSNPLFSRVWFYEAAGTEYYRATSVLLDVQMIRKRLHRCLIAHSPDLQDYWTAVEKAWRSGSREYEKLKYEEYKKLSEFEELENTFKGTDVHTFRDEFANIYEAVHVKLNALDFLDEFKSTISEQVKNKAIILGVDPENIKECHLRLFEGCPNLYNILVIKVFANKVNEASFEQLVKLLSEHNDEFKKITFELASLKECDKLATEIREGTCSISNEGKITCSETIWIERVNDFKWLGYILFKPTKPYQSSYLRDLLSREQQSRQRYGHMKLIHMFINDVERDSSVHPGRPTKRMHFSTRVFDFDFPTLKYDHDGTTQFN